MSSSQQAPGLRRAAVGHAQRRAAVRHPRPRPEISATIWRSLTDPGARIYAFESSVKPDIFWVRTGQFDYTRCARLDPAGDDLAGHVTSELAAPEPAATP